MHDTSLKPIRLVVLDNQALVRAGLCLLIGNQPDMEVVGHAGNPNEAMSLIASTRPDIILLEYAPESGLSFDVFPNMNNAWVQARMIMVTSSNDRLIYLQAVQNGVLGVVSKSQQPDVLIKAIRKVHAGEIWIEHSLIANFMIGSVHGVSTNGGNHTGDGIGQLSDREKEVIQYIGRGMKNKQIASQLCIGETTVRHHLTSIYGKLGVSDRLELLVFSQRHRLTKLEYQ